MSTHSDSLRGGPKVTSFNRLFTAVIASTCDDARSALLSRACESVRAMARGHDYSILVVANGPRVSPQVLDWLATKQDVRVIRLRSGSYPLARRVGAEMAESEFLGFLDDDDELMPDTLAPKISEFREHPDVDVIVTDGLRVSDATETRILPPPEARSADLVETMMSVGWGAGSLTLRTSNIDLSAFDPKFRHLEWTLAAFALARHHRFSILDQPMYRYYENTPDSLSKSAEYGVAAPSVWQRLSEVYSGTRYEPMVRRRYGLECHWNSVRYAHQGRIRDAWRFHADSLRSPGAASFIPYSAKLGLHSLRALFP